MSFAAPRPGEDILEVVHPSELQLQSARAASDRGWVHGCEDPNWMAKLVPSTLGHVVLGLWCRVRRSSHALGSRRCMGETSAFLGVVWCGGLATIPEPPSRVGSFPGLTATVDRLPRGDLVAGPVGWTASGEADVTPLPPFPPR